MTDKCLSAMNFSADLGKTTQNICLNKTHEHGDISVHIFKIRATTVTTGWEVIFKKAFVKGPLLSVCEENNMKYVYKRVTK